MCLSPNLKSIKVHNGRKPMFDKVKAKEPDIIPNNLGMDLLMLNMTSWTCMAMVGCYIK